MQLLEYFKDKRITFFSDSDLDGVGARVIAQFYIQPTAKEFFIITDADRKMTAFNYNYMKQSDIIIFCDITPTLDLVKEIYSVGKEIFIFDHHVSTFPELSLIIPEDHYFFNIDKCGTKILFDEITKGIRVRKVIYQFVELVNTYDLYNDISGLWHNAKKLHHVLMGTINWFNTDIAYDRYEEFVIGQLRKFEIQKNFCLTKYEEVLACDGLRKEQTNYEQAKKSLKKRVDNSGGIYVYCECDSKLSLVANRIIKEMPDIDYFIFHSTFLEKSKHELNGKISLRCSNEKAINVAEIAALHGGGGHKQAAGVELSLDDFQKLKQGVLHLI